MFLDKLREHKMVMDIIPGNHDTFYKSTNELSALVEILQHYTDVVNLHMDPTVLDFDGLGIAMLPWINPENYDESLDFISNTSAPILGAHLELAGFDMMRGIAAPSHGMDARVFDKFEMVMSGHYHTKSTKGNVHYLGTPLEQTWADCNDPKYFHILDTATRELKPVQNTITLYHKVAYDDSEASDDIGGELAKCNFGSLKDTFVRVIVKTKKKPKMFDGFIDLLTSVSPFDLKVVENFEEYQSTNVADTNIEVTDTVTLLNTYVDSVVTDLDRGRLKSKLSALWTEAQNIDVVS
jgi:DNA repair exonuclease SbcCD nuclease subunit